MEVKVVLEYQVDAKITGTPLKIWMLNMSSRSSGMEEALEWNQTFAPWFTTLWSVETWFLYFCKRRIYYWHTSKLMKFSKRKNLCITKLPFIPNKHRNVSSYFWQFHVEETSLTTLPKRICHKDQSQDHDTEGPHLTPYQASLILKNSQQLYEIPQGVRKTQRWCFPIDIRRRSLGGVAFEQVPAEAPFR